MPFRAGRRMPAAADAAQAGHLGRGRRGKGDDYKVHVGSVSECVSRKRLSQALQDELDDRYLQRLAVSDGPRPWKPFCSYG